VEAFCCTEVTLLPRFHKKEVGFPVDVLVKFTHSGAHPVVKLAVKLATGCASSALLHISSQSNKEIRVTVFISLPFQAGNKYTPLCVIYHNISQY
jgi:hypothetical protein